MLVIKNMNRYLSENTPPFNSPLSKGGYRGVAFICFSALALAILLFVSQVHATTSLTYEYDANGNLIQGDGKYYEYNDANQLVRVRHGDQNGPIIAQYFYDYTGQRIKKIENGVTTYYIGKHYETQVNGESQTNTSYYFANGERIAKKDTLGNVYYYHSDHLGGTNVITDSAGNLIERIKYYPFGEIREGGNEKYSFTGKEKDKLTEFYYFEARYYNPEFKHFTQADTTAANLYDPQNLNKYSYARNNPLKYIDPSGHTTIDPNIKNNPLLQETWTNIKNDTTIDETGKEISDTFSESNKVITEEYENLQKQYDEKKTPTEPPPGLQKEGGTGCVVVCRGVHHLRTENGELYEKTTYEYGVKFGGYQSKVSGKGEIKEGKEWALKGSVSYFGLAGVNLDTKGTFRAYLPLYEIETGPGGYYSKGLGQGWIFGFPISVTYSKTRKLKDDE